MTARRASSRPCGTISARPACPSASKKVIVQAPCNLTRSSLVGSWPGPAAKRNIAVATRTGGPMSPSYLLAPRNSCVASGAPGGRRPQATVVSATFVPHWPTSVRCEMAGNDGHGRCALGRVSHPAGNRVADRR
jgi:hypothetical protein